MVTEEPTSVVGVAPDPVTGLTAAAYYDAVELTWTAPIAADWKDVVVRMSAHSTVPPTTVTDGYGGSRKTVTTGKTSSTKATTFTVKPTSRGKHIYRVVAARGSGLAAGTSARIALTVT